MQLSRDLKREFAWAVKNTVSALKREAAESKLVKAYAAHFIAQRAMWTVQLMPFMSALQLGDISSDPTSLEACEIDPRTAQLLREWEDGKSDAMVKYQVVVECNLGLMFSRGVRQQLPWGFFTVCSRTPFELFPIAMQSIAQAILASENGRQNMQMMLERGQKQIGKEQKRKAVRQEEYLKRKNKENWAAKQHLLTLKAHDSRGNARKEGRRFGKVANYFIRGRGMTGPRGKREE